MTKAATKPTALQKLLVSGVGYRNLDGEHMKGLSCCGVGQFHGINHGEAFTLGDVIKATARHLYLDSCESRAIMIYHGVREDRRWPPKYLALKRFLTSHGLGVVEESADFKNPNTGNMIRQLTWHVDHTAFLALVREVWPSDFDDSELDEDNPLAEHSSNGDW